MREVKIAASLGLVLFVTPSCVNALREADIADEAGATRRDPTSAEDERDPASAAPARAEIVQDVGDPDDNENEVDSACSFHAVTERRTPRARDWCCMLETPSGAYNCHQWHTAGAWALAKCKGLGELRRLPSKLTEGSCDASACITIDD